MIQVKNYSVNGEGMKRKEGKSERKRFLQVQMNGAGGMEPDAGVGMRGGGKKKKWR